MAKKLLSIFAAVSMAASAMANLTIVSAAGGLNVTDCNIANNAENVNTAAIVLTFDDKVTADDVLGAVTINGQSDNYNVEVKDNKAQLAIKGVTKNTNYTLNVKESGNETFTRNFMTGNVIYSSDWSKIETNMNRLTRVSDDWGGTCSEFISDDDDYLKMVNKNKYAYTLEPSAAEGVLEIEYERYIPEYKTDSNGNPTEVKTENPNYSVADYIQFDNGKEIGYGSIWWSQTISYNEWHTYKYVINFDKKTFEVYVDGEKKTNLLNDDVKTQMTDATCAAKLVFSFGGASDVKNREQWIKNIRTVRRNTMGSWYNNQLSEVNGITTWTLGNTSNSKQERYYKIAKTTGDSAKVSFELKFNDAMKTLTDDIGSEYGNTSIRLASNNGNGYHSICYPFRDPKISYWANDSDPSKVIFNLPEGETFLAPNVWHKYEFVYDFDSDNGKRILKYAVIDGAITVCASENTTGAYLDYIDFFIKENNSITLDEKPVLQIKDINVIDNYKVGDLSVTSNIPSDGVITPNEIKINFSSPITKESLNKLVVYNFDTDEEMDATFELDKTQQELTIKMSQYDMNTEYQIRLKNVAGYLGGSLKNTNMNFTTPIKENITGKWTDKWWSNKSGASITENQDGSVTMIAVNDQKDYDGSGNYQSNRNSFAYSFDKTVTGEDVPLTIKYSFKANEALTKSPSPVRLYGAEKTLGGCFNVSGAYNSLMYDDWYSYNKANKPAGVDSVTPDEWHTIEYAINVNSTSGSTLKYIIYDGVITYASTTGGKPMHSSALKGVQNIDFWFYSTSATTDNYELQVKDLSVTKGASSFDVTASNADLTAENNKIHLEFINPVNEADLKSGVKVMNGTSVVENAISAYALSVDGRSADVTIADIATGEYVLSFASLADVYGNKSETASFNFNYTAASKEGVVAIKSATVREVTTGDKNMVEVSIDLSNGKFSSVSGKLIAAAYDNENKLVGIGFVNATLNQETQSQAETVTFDKPTSYTSVKVMLWDDFDTANALCASFDAPLNSAVN